MLDVAGAEHLMCGLQISNVEELIDVRFSVYRLLIDVADTEQATEQPGANISAVRQRNISAVFLTNLEPDLQFGAKQ